MVDTIAHSITRQSTNTGRLPMTGDADDIILTYLHSPPLVEKVKGA